MSVEAPKVCQSCGNRVYFSGGHHYSCPVRRSEEAYRRKYFNEDPYGLSPSYDDLDEDLIMSGLTESEFFGGDVGDKG